MWCRLQIERGVSRRNVGNGAKKCAVATIHHLMRVYMSVQFLGLVNDRRNTKFANDPILVTPRMEQDSPSS